MSNDHHCHGDECKVQGQHSHSHHGHGEGSCCSECNHCSCECHKQKSFPAQLLEMADQAWMEVLQEKVKQHIEKSSGSHLDELAKLVAESNNNRWKNKMAMQKGCHSFTDKIREFFSREK